MLIVVGRSSFKIHGLRSPQQNIGYSVSTPTGPASISPRATALPITVPLELVESCDSSAVDHSHRWGSGDGEDVSVRVWESSFRWLRVIEAVQSHSLSKRYRTVSPIWNVLQVKTSSPCARAT